VPPPTKINRPFKIHLFFIFPTQLVKWEFLQQ